jgi:hypothetical protein
MDRAVAINAHDEENGCAKPLARLQRSEARKRRTYRHARIYGSFEDNLVADGLRAARTWATEAARGAARAALRRWWQL